MKEFKTIGKNVVMVFFARGFDVLASMAIITILTRYLNVDLYGKYSFIMALVFTMTSFSHLGMPKILIREISQNKTLADHYLGASLLFTVITFAGVMVLSLSAAVLLGVERTLIFCLFIAIFAEMLLIIAGLFTSIFFAFERMGFDTLMTTFHRSLLLILLLLVVVLKLDFLYIFLSMLLTQSIALFFAVVVCRKVFSVRPDFQKWKMNLKYLFMEVLPVGSSFVILQAYQYLDIFVVKYFRGFSEVALFQAPYALILKGQLLPRILVMALAPVLARLASADSSRRNIGYVYTTILKYLAIISIPLAAFGAFFADTIVVLLFGRNFLDAAVVMRILLCALPVMFMDSFSDAILISIGRQKLTVISTGISLAVNLILATVLVNKYGYRGAAIAFLVSSVCLFILNYYFISRYVKELSLFKIIRTPGIAALLAGFSLPLVSHHNLSAALGIGAVIYIGVLAISKVFSKEELFAISGILDRSRNVGTVSKELIGEGAIRP